MDLRSLQARWVTEDLPAGDVPAAATELLARGVETPTLIWIAGMEGATRWQVAPLMERVFQEAGLPPINREAALWIAAYDAARRIRNGSVEPRIGAAELWRICTALDMPEPLRYFVYLAADYGEGPSGKEWFDERIRESAAELIAEMPPDGESPPRRTEGWI